MVFYKMMAAIALSAGNKAKTRNLAGETLIVSLLYLSPEMYWMVNRIGVSGEFWSYGCGGRFSRVEQFAIDNDADVEQARWLPVETPFPEE